MIKKVFILGSFILFSIGYLLSQERKDFKIFNALLFKETPNLHEYGFSEINMIYEDGVISTNYRKEKGDFEWRFVDFKKVLKESNKSKNSINIPTVLDVEYCLLEIGNRGRRYLCGMGSERIVEVLWNLNVIH